MSDQEIIGHFNSSDIIVFYTPQGMEIGFNYDEGWVTVTYKEYEQYLKVFWEYWEEKELAVMSAPFRIKGI